MWQYSLLVPFTVSIFQLLFLPLPPESPSFLYKLGKKDEAAKALRFFRKGAVKTELELDLLIKEEMEELELELNGGDSSNGGNGGSQKEPTILDLVVRSKKSVQMPILIGIIVNLTMQLSGTDAVLYYSTEVFMNAGISLEKSEVCTTLVGFVNFLVTIPAMMLMDKAGRKTIQLAGLGGMFIGYNIMVFSQCMAIWAQKETYGNEYIEKNYGNISEFGYGFETIFEPIMSFIDYDILRPLYMNYLPITITNPVLFYRYLSVFAMMWIVICFAFGPGCIAWFIITELCPVQARSTATALGLGFNALANWAVAFFFPLCLMKLGRFTFVIFIFFTSLFFTLTKTLLPETKGKSNVEIEKFFVKKYDK